MDRKITRRQALGLGAAASFAFTTTAAFTSMPARGAQAVPNILWIVSDDQPQYMLDPMVNVRNRIRDKGIDFKAGSADIPLCGPARVSLLTGLSVTTHNCNTNGSSWSDFRDSPRGLQNRTVNKYLRDAGYITGHFGKYINGHNAEGTVPPHWNRFISIKGDGADSGGNATTANQGNIDGGGWFDLPPGVPPSVWASRRLEEFIEAQQNVPWFAHYCPTIPHDPYTTTPESEHTYDGARRNVSSVNEADMSDKPQWMRDLPNQTGLQEEYEGKMEELVDLDSKCIGPILDKLLATGQLANTVIFYVSDNGYMHGEHRLRRKDQPYWESSEVPFLVKGPDVLQGVGREALVSHVDLMPTTCEYAGIPFSSLDVDGRSMKANLGRPAFQDWRKRMLVTGSDDVGPQLNPGGSNDPSGRWWLLRDEFKAFIMRESGAKELYYLGADPLQERSKHNEASNALIQELTETVWAMRSAEGAERRSLEEAP